MIVASPAATPVTLPVASTVAFVSSLEDQMIGELEFSGVRVATKFNEEPTSRSAVALSKATHELLY